MNQVSQGAIKLAKKSRFWKPSVCQAIPHYMKPKLRDPFEYPLRSKQEIQQQLAEFNPLKNLEIGVCVHYHGDLHGSKEVMNRKIQLEVDMNDLRLSSLQKQRLIFLLGPRYKNNDILKITIQNFQEYEANIERGKEMIYELYMEAIRAPMSD